MCSELVFYEIIDLEVVKWDFLFFRKNLLLEIIAKQKYCFLVDLNKAFIDEFIVWV